MNKRIMISLQNKYTKTVVKGILLYENPAFYAVAQTCPRPVEAKTQFCYKEAWIPKEDTNRDTIVDQ